MWSVANPIYREVIPRELSFIVQLNFESTFIELKLRYYALERTIAEGLEQTWDYMDLCCAEAGHLVIFDRAEGKSSWAEKIFRRKETYRGIAITVWGM